MIIKISYPISKGLEREITSIRNSLPDTSTMFSEFPACESYFENFMSKPDGIEIGRNISGMGSQLCILDIGAGNGYSSIYLASKGHSVSVVEPSPDLCNIIDAAANKYGLKITVYNCAAEYINKIPKTNFDVALFNASLHHCDDPVLALNNCHHALIEGGTLVVANETFLPFFRSKKRYYRRLETHSQQMGHYGGNEHTYRYHEYLKMIRMGGFSNVRSILNIRNSNCNLVMRQIGGRCLKGKPIYDFKRKLVRRMYFSCICRLSRDGLLGAGILSLMKRLSMLTVTFVATK